MATLLCVPILVRDGPSAFADAGAARDAGADLVEFRLDEVFSGDGDAEGEALAVKLVSESPLPCIVTCRPASEGGTYDGDDAARIALFERLGNLSGARQTPPRFIDVELATYTRSQNARQKVDLAVDHPTQRREHRPSLILSAHDFAGRPADLTRRLLAMRAEPAARVLKIAYRARSLRDNTELFDIVAESDRPTIALGMGDFGLMSRVLAPKFGAFLTFASLRAESATAPGQPTVSDLLGVYRWRSITRATSVYGVVGWPVGHSLSPLVHNAGFESVAHDGVYLPLPVASAANGAGYESFKATLAELVDHPRLDFAGCSVTLPHKENLTRLALERRWELDEASAAIGAANTLIVARDGAAFSGARVMNTDVEGVVGALRAARGNRPVGGLRVAVVGAGGAARAAAYGLARGGAKVTVMNRTVERAGRVAEEISSATSRPVSVAELGSKRAGVFDVFLNCTPVGMRGGPAPDTSPLPVRELARAGHGPRTIAFDTVYNPVVTPFLREARAAGWRTIDGVAMFVRQAAVQFEAWTGRSAPRGLFERLVREAIPAL